MDALGQAIRNARKANGWTQQELADYISEEIGRETGLNQTVLSRWEQRDTTIPDEALRALSKCGSGMNLTEARRLNGIRVRDKDPRERLAEVEYEVKVVNQKLDKLLEALNASS